MNKVMGYNTFQNNYFNNTVQNKKETDRSEERRVGKEGG